MAFVKSQSNKP